MANRFNPFERDREHERAVDAMNPGVLSFREPDAESAVDRLARLEREYVDKRVNGWDASWSPELVAIIAARAAVRG